MNDPSQHLLNLAVPLLILSPLDTHTFNMKYLKYPPRGVDRVTQDVKVIYYLTTTDKAAIHFPVRCYLLKVNGDP